MKNYLLTLCFVFILFEGKAQTNVYHPFPDSSANWNFTVQNVCWGVTGNSLYQHQMSIVFGPDTVINMTTYHSLYIPAYIVNAGPHCYNPPAGNYILPGKYAGAIRNDHAARKTYIIPEQTSVEQLLYDFNWQVGDTITGYLNHTAAAFEDTVISIDSVLVGSTYRKRWFIDPWYQVYLIEGIGSTYGILNPLPAGISDFDDYVLDCFSQNNVPLYPSGTPGCPVLTEMADVPDPETELIVYPNPAGKYLNLQLPSDSRQQLTEVSVFGMDGKRVSQQSLNSDQEATLKVVLPALENGFYLLKAAVSGKQFQTRFQVRN